MTYIRCDKCGKEVERHECWSKDITFTYVKDGVYIDHAVDLCKACAEEVYDYLYAISESRINKGKSD